MQYFFRLFFFLYLKIVRKKITGWSTLFQLNTGNLQTLVSSAIKGIKDIFVYNLQEDFIKKFLNFSKNSYLPSFKQDFINTIKNVMVESPEELPNKNMKPIVSLEENELPDWLTAKAIGL